MYAVVVVNVTNDGDVPDVAFKLGVLKDERGRRFEALSATSFGPYFDLTREYGVGSHVDTVQPGLASRVLWVFEVPSTVQRLTLEPSAPCRTR
jgi:hypothetical protein